MLRRPWAPDLSAPAALLPELPPAALAKLVRSPETNVEVHGHILYQQKQQQQQQQHQQQQQLS